MRDFVHVSDVARASRLALEVEAAANQVFNIGSGRRYTVREIARSMSHGMADMLGRRDVQPEVTGKYRVGDIRHCFATSRWPGRCSATSPRCRSSGD
jgi:dTDP-L-rhamnose 4-epimerase